MTKSIREGADSVEAVTSRTAATNESQSQHAPLPWMRGIVIDVGSPVPNLVIDARREPVFDATGHTSFANAELIVRACNHHEALLEAVRAGARYSDALRRYQDKGLNGQVIPGTDELDRLFMDWHDKGHAAIGNAEGN